MLTQTHNSVAYICHIKVVTKRNIYKCESDSFIMNYLQPLSHDSISNGVVQSPRKNKARKSINSFTSNRRISVGDTIWQIKIDRPEDLEGFPQKSEKVQFETLKEAETFQEDVHEYRESVRSIGKDLTVRDNQKGLAIAQQTVSYCQALDTFVKNHITFEETRTTEHSLADFTAPQFRGLTNTFLTNIGQQRQRVEAIENHYGIFDGQIIESRELISDLLRSYLHKLSKTRDVDFEQLERNKFPAIKEINSNGTFLEIQVDPHFYLLDGAVGNVRHPFNRSICWMLNKTSMKTWDNNRYKNLPIAYTISSDKTNTDEVRLHEMKHCIDHLLERGTSEFSAHMYTDRLRETDLRAGVEANAACFYQREESQHHLISDRNLPLQRAMFAYTDMVRAGNDVLARENKSNVINKLVSNLTHDILIDSQLDVGVKSYLHQLFPEILPHYAHSILTQRND